MKLKTEVIRIGTRKSKLALAQVEILKSALKAVVPSIELEVVPMTTTGDALQGAPSDGHEAPRQRGYDKRVWIDTIENAVLSGEVDVALHSGKDIPESVHSETALMSVTRRESPFDVMIASAGSSTKQNFSLDDLLPGAQIGTTSLRRKAQLLRMRSDLNISSCGGNVDTRVKKLHNREFEAIVLAAAGVNRLGMLQDRALLIYKFTAQEMLPAVNQGILVAQIRHSRSELRLLLEKVLENDTQIAFLAERALIEKLGASCRSAVGVFATVHGTKVSLIARVLSEDGKECIEEAGEALCAEAEKLGIDICGRLLERGARKLLEP